MKLYTQFFFISLILSALISSCQKPVGVLDQTCYKDRKVEETVQGRVAIVALWNDIYLLTSEDGTEKWQPCDLPPDFKVEKIKVVFSGDVMSIFPGERRVASPLHLKSISKQ
jgi:hypothetical protein